MSITAGVVSRKISILASSASSSSRQQSCSFATSAPSQRFISGLRSRRRIEQLHAHIVPAAALIIRAMASTTESELSKVAIKRNGDGETVFDAYVVGSKGAPGIVVLQEWWGIDFEIKNHASAIAKKGYRALIPDLYRGKVGLDAAEAHHLMEGLDWQGAVKDIAASVKWLKENGSPKVGVTGFCMGGALSLASAVLVPGIDAAVAFYGTPNPGLADVSKVKVPVQAHFGEKDSTKGFSDLEAANALEEKLKASGVPSEVFIYPGQGHAFMNSSEEAIKRKKAVGFEDHDQGTVDLAWSRFDAWFDKYVKS
ncbi:unnamed protein product [Calypogeia fissa]